MATVLDDTVSNLIEKLNDNSATGKMKGALIHVKIRAYGAEVLNLFKNITETSFKQDDFEKRVKEMCEKFGLDKDPSGKFY